MKTDAERAHERLFESWPRDRITTHLKETYNAARRSYDSERPHAKRTPALTAYRREWIKNHHKTMSRRDMARCLGVAAPSITKHLHALGIPLQARRKVK